LFIAGYFVYGTQPGIGTPPDTVVAFYASHHTRILWAAVFFGLGGVLKPDVVRSRDQEHAA